jgi:hypothetical protein
MIIKADCPKGYVITHAQMIANNGVIIAPLHDFAHPSSIIL